MKKVLYLIGLVVTCVVGYGVYFVYEAAPIGNGYTSKYICSQVFLAQRDPEYVFEQDVKPTNPLFDAVSFQVDTAKKTVTARLFGFMRPITAAYREGFGCTLMINTTREELLDQAKGAIPQSTSNDKLIWPRGEAVDFNSVTKEVNREKLYSVLASAFVEPVSKDMRNTQAIVVVYKDKIIAEKYHEQFSRSTPILGWSMSKSITNALVGILVKDGKLDIMKPAPVEAWKSAGDPRGKITLDQMLRMSSGLDFDEVYAPLKDATYMLYGSKSMADYTIAKPLRIDPDKKWYYSSGTTNIIARIVRDTTGGTLVSSNNFARRRLFDRIGMFSAIIEPDASRSFVGSSYMFATPRDWARFGLLIKNDGIWSGERILPEGWVKYSSTPTPLAPQGEYGAQFWLNAGTKGNPGDRRFPSLPTDMVYLSGFNGQITAVIPSKNLIVVRMGVTHDRSWRHEELIAQILESIEN